MADYLAENNYLFQGNFSSSYLYFSNFANKDNDFGNALKTSTDEQLNTTGLAAGGENKGISYTRIVSATVVNSEPKPIEKSEEVENTIDTQEALKKLIEEYLKKDSNDEEVDWRNMTDEEWKKLLERIDADIDDMVKRVKEETEEAKEEQAKEALEKEAVEETL